MTINTPNAGLPIIVEVDDDSVRYRELMGDDSLTLKFSLAEYIEIPIGSYVTYQSQRYDLYRPANAKKVHDRLYEFTATFHAPYYKCKQYIFKNPIDGRIKFPLTAQPQEFLQMFVDNMNDRDSGWSVGDCVTDVEHCVSFESANCIEAIQQIADEFKTEWEINDKVVSLHKVEYYASDPVELSYGKGNGLRSGITRTIKDESPIERLYVQGGEQNINYKTYGSKTLLMPNGGVIAYDGEKFEGEEGFRDDKARTYKVETSRNSIVRDGVVMQTKAEGSTDLEEYYPKRVGTISSVTCVSEPSHFYDFFDADANCPNYNDYKIAGETMSVIFQSGMLAGKEFDVNYIREASGLTDAQGNNIYTNKFEIVPQEIDGIIMPTSEGGYLPAVGDKYAIFHCALPSEYFSVAGSKVGAEWDLFKAAVRYMRENEDERITIDGEVDPIWARENWSDIGERLVVGGSVEFSDDGLLGEEGKIDIRIKGMKDYINNPYKIELTLSNETPAPNYRATIRGITSATIGQNQTLTEGTNVVKRKTTSISNRTDVLEQSSQQAMANIDTICAFLNNKGVMICDGQVCTTTPEDIQASKDDTTGLWTITTKKPKSLI